MKRTISLALGWVLVALGVVGLFLPLLQGLLLIAAGLLVLSRNSEHARGWIGRFRRRWPRLDCALRRLQRRRRADRGAGPGEETPARGAGYSETTAGTNTGSPETLSTTDP
jgi:hypothetical protein